jgi:hypothetical protein
MGLNFPTTYSSLYREGTGHFKRWTGLRLVVQALRLPLQDSEPDLTAIFLRLNGFSRNNLKDLHYG